MANQQVLSIQKSIPVIGKVDVLVVVSGIAGSTAAVTAADSTVSA